MDKRPFLPFGLTKQQFLIGIVAILLIIYIFLRVGCGNQVKFNPAQIGAGFFPSSPEYYSYFDREKVSFEKFNSKNEAVSYCVWSRVGF
jgi:hypothetical protein